MSDNHFLTQILNAEKQALKWGICDCPHSKVVDFALISCVCQAEDHFCKTKVKPCKIAVPQMQHVIDTCHISTHTPGAVVSVCLRVCVCYRFFNGCLRAMVNTWCVSVKNWSAESADSVPSCHLRISPERIFCYVICLPTQGNIFIAQ